MKKAFTLIELLIVMTVIAILAGILIPSFRSYQQEAWHTKTEGDISGLQLAVESFFTTHDNRYPEELSELITSSPRFIQQLPKDPYRTSGVSYGYTILAKKPGSESFYIIYSYGPNHIRNWSWDATKGMVMLDQNSDDIVFTNAIIE
jgi:general secretion pathway protein G